VAIAELPNVTAGLLEMGFTKEDVAKFLGGNFIWVFESVWAPVSRVASEPSDSLNSARACS